MFSGKVFGMRFSLRETRQCSVILGLTDMDGKTIADEEGSLLDFFLDDFPLHIALLSGHNRGNLHRFIPRIPGADDARNSIDNIEDEKWLG